MMKQAIFQTSAHAKCILAGEYAVIRGYPGVVLPINNILISLSYENTGGALKVVCRSPFEDTFLLFFWKALECGLSLLKTRIHDLNGKFIIENNIPMGVGIGFSSALSVVLTRWFVWEHLLGKNELFSFAHHLEDIFHGTSNGIDIIGAMSNYPTHFEKSGNTHKILPAWKPKLYISYSGHIKNTADALKHVNQFREQYPKESERLDKEMGESAFMIEQALKMDEKNGFNLLAKAINQASHCFQHWGLITPALQIHINELQQAGALATKPTGAGEGGYVLSLWKDAPPASMMTELMPLFG